MTLETLDAEIIVVSDIHLGNLTDRRGQLLMKLLTHLSQKVRYFIFNGDIFDFCFGKNVYFRQKFYELGIILDRLNKNGTQVLFLEGNHEFAMEELAWNFVKIITEKYYIINSIDGNSIAITHGDLLTEDPLYQRFRALLKSKKTHFLADLLPGRFLDTYALNHAKISRSRDQYRQIDHEKVVKNAFKWLEETGANTGVFGHFHIPYCENRAINGENRKIICLESWDYPNLLAYRDRSFYRAYLGTWEKTGYWEFSEPKSYFLKSAPGSL
jgi:UDP-2,3-diacylglucosamine hydrolase